jgi:hypothetical protein
MKKEDLLNIAKTRIAVGYLGEKDQNNWWPSKFFVKESESFLAPVFAKTSLLARYHGVSEAASIVHDKLIIESANFEMLRAKWPDLANLGGYAELYPYSDHQSCMVKLRCFVEILVGWLYRD